ncbi:Oidioi.mRNA.OKI2018_I69.chr2.g7961.t1.cds [Oikopleura dioica]|uniref:Oidioi.mRNA.OKI2018_I69.chr2.g7961.t1.cds n=1 Tax=Oikopleura dioica TaxID=34765 RepID=A0ABN7T7T0_OIKDI|nr:Oidioi.mRNA.OKI2018_I69.chr2.g7961.t1.cds [Oikopleura dioica]
MENQELEFPSDSELDTINKYIKDTRQFAALVIDTCNHEGVEFLNPIGVRVPGLLHRMEDMREILKKPFWASLDDSHELAPLKKCTLQVLDKFEDMCYKKFRHHIEASIESHEF